MHEANTIRRADLILRVGAAFAFMYPALSAIFGDPYTWFGYFPPFLMGYVPDMVLLHAFGAVEIIIALWILSGYKVFIPAALATLMLVAIVVLNYSQFDTLFRDLTIASLTLALAVMHWPAKASILRS